jgi:hypothetical protein
MTMMMCSEKTPKGKERLVLKPSVPLSMPMVTNEEGGGGGGDEDDDDDDDDEIVEEESLKRPRLMEPPASTVPTHKKRKDEEFRAKRKLEDNQPRRGRPPSVKAKVVREDDGKIKEKEVKIEAEVINDLERDEDEKVIEDNPVQVSSGQAKDNVTTTLSRGDSGAHANVTTSFSLPTSTLASAATVVVASSQLCKPRPRLAYSSATNKPVCLCIIWVHLRASTTSEAPLTIGNEAGGDSRQQRHRCLVRLSHEMPLSDKRIICNYCR